MLGSAHRQRHEDAPPGAKQTGRMSPVCPDGGVVARIKMKQELPRHPRFQVLIALDFGRPNSNISFRTVQAISASAFCAFG